ncbi:hypothetical protein NST11_02185 [Caldifermentibacillus hisashii]|jgi:hypothetical protein
MNLVVKIEACSPQNGDENGLRRQKLDFLGQNWRRKTGIADLLVF